MGLNPSSPEELETKSIFFWKQTKRETPPPPSPKDKKKTHGIRHFIADGADDAPESGVRWSAD